MTPECPPNAGAFCKVPESQQQWGLGLGQCPTCPGRGRWGERRGKEGEEEQWGSSGMTGPGNSPPGTELLTWDLTDLNNP